ncbi:MAG: PocR ligand-binding domain-containing protein [Ruminococcus sp.]|nr:PocR ligand-binding domain-containing protein [Ruminococcus sp.]
MPKYSLSRLFDKGLLQDLQNVFSDYMGISAVITDSEGKQITQSSNFSRICRKLLRNSADNVEKCMSYSIKGAVKSNSENKPCIYKCHAGLYEISAPIMLEDLHIGCFVCGQIICTDENESDVINKIMDIGLNQEDAIKAVSELKRLSMDEIQHTAQFVFNIAKLLSTMAYKNYVLFKNNRLRSAAAFTGNELSSIPDKDVIYNSHELTSSITTNIKSFFCNMNITPELHFLSEIPDELLGNPGIISYVIDVLLSTISKNCDFDSIVINFSCSEICYSHTLAMDIIIDNPIYTDNLVGTLNKIFYHIPDSDEEASNIKNLIYNKLNGSVCFNMSENNRFTARLEIPQMDIRGNNYEQ